MDRSNPTDCPSYGPQRERLIKKAQTAIAGLGLDERHPEVRGIRMTQEQGHPYDDTMRPFQSGHRAPRRHRVSRSRAESIQINWSS